MKSEKFTSSLLRYLEKLKEKYGEKEGNIQFIMTLKLKRQSSTVDFEMAIALRDQINLLQKELNSKKEAK